MDGETVQKEVLMDIKQDSLELFLSLSVGLTGFEQAELLGTGMTQTYYDQLVGVIGEEIAAELWVVAARLTLLSGEELDTAIRRELMASVKFGPIARNIIQLWYWGAWVQLPADWRSRYGNSPQDVTGFTGAAGYQEGLIWKVMQTHPQGAKQPGFGSWGLLPHNALRR